VNKVMTFSLTISMSLFLSLSLALPSYAQNKKNNQKTIGDLLKNIEKRAETVQFNKQKSSLPAAAVQKQAPPANVNLRAVKPPSSKKLYYDDNSDEGQLEKILDEQTNQLFKLTQQYKKSTKRGELWLRLAELYVEKARLIEFQIHTRHDKQMESFQEGKTKTRPKLNLTPSLEYNKKAIQLYEWFIRDFPKDPKMDQALFFLGFNHFEISNVKKGEEYYLRLTKEYPNSSYVGESYFALGEYNFDNEKWAVALKNYEKVVEDKKGRLYSFGLYKSAWCYYKLQKTGTALKLLERVILEGRRSKSVQNESGVSRVRLATEAVKDLIIFYAEAGDPAKARDYFEEVVGKKSALANLGKLAQYYMDTGNRSAARTIYKELIAENPDAPRSFDYQHNIVKMYQAAGQVDVFLKELYVWLDAFGPSSDWHDKNKKEKDLIAKANEVMEGTLRNYVLQQHQTAQNAKTRTAQASAQRGYDLYFKTFSTSSKIDEMHFFYAELLFDMQDFEKASYHYNWVTTQAPKSPYFERATLNNLLSLEKKLPSNQAIKKLVKDNTNPVEFTEDVSAFVDAAKKYLDTKPKGDNVASVKYRLGSLYYYFNQFDPALAIFNDIIKTHTKTDLARFSANHILDIYNLKNDYVGLQNAADDILKVPELARSDVGTQIRDIKLRTDFKLAKEFEDKKEFGKAAQAYEDFATRNRSSALASSAVFNAGVNYERAGDSLKAIAMYGIILNDKQKANEGLRQKASQFLPAMYERTGQYQRAAQLFEAFAVENPKNKIAVEYYYNAAVIFDGLNSYQSALKNYEKYFDLKKTRERLEVIFLMASLYERMGRADYALSQYEKYINSGTSNANAVVEAHYRIAKIHQKRNRTKLVTEWNQKTVAVQSRLARRGTPVGISFAAEAKFQLVQPTYDELVKIRIPQSPAAQGEAVQKKLKLLNRLQAELKAVIAYDDGYQIVSALSLQGQALQHMYTSLINAPTPKGLTVEETKAYKEGVDKIAVPFKTQAIGSYELAVSRGNELQAYNSALITAVKNLEVLKGNKLPLDTKVMVTKLPDWMGM
jgi:cellulose synthase operon protein C